jgi:hypothetical protein
MEMSFSQFLIIALPAALLCRLHPFDHHIVVEEVKMMMSLAGWIMHGNEQNELDINIQSSFMLHSHPHEDCLLSADIVSIPITR